MSWNLCNSHIYKNPSKRPTTAYRKQSIKSSSVMFRWACVQLTHNFQFFSLQQNSLLSGTEQLQASGSYLKDNNTKLWQKPNSFKRGCENPGIACKFCCMWSIFQGCKVQLCGNLAITSKLHLKEICKYKCNNWLKIMPNFHWRYWSFYMQWLCYGILKICRSTEVCERLKKQIKQKRIRCDSFLLFGLQNIIRNHFMWSSNFKSHIIITVVCWIPAFKSQNKLCRTTLFSDS